MKIQGVKDKNTGLLVKVNNLREITRFQKFSCEIEKINSCHSGIVSIDPGRIKHFTWGNLLSRGTHNNFNYRQATVSVHTL